MNVPLTDMQMAAVAKLAYGSSRDGCLALLCGPRGVGKTEVLRRLAAEIAATRSVAVRPASGWDASAPLAAVMLVDDAHAVDTATLARILQQCQERRPAAGLVLAGAGRLFTLVARDARLEQAVRLRVALPCLSTAESRRLLEATLQTALAAPCSVDDDAARAVHEIAGGAAADVIRLAEVAGVVMAAQPERRLAAAAVEAIHARLSLAAA